MLSYTLQSAIKSLHRQGIPALVTPLVNLRLFRYNESSQFIQSADLSGYLGKNKSANGGVPSSSARRSVKVKSRKRNVFLDPDNEKAKAKDLMSLYDSSRFNRDDSDDEDSFTSQQTNTIEADNNGDDDDHEATTSDTPPQLPQLKEGQKLVLPPPRGVKIKTADFIKSSPNVKLCPPAIYPEFAVIGRSNVGKSSLINMMTGRTALAMVSKTPGKTRLINHFLINKSWYLVDLPGYGYARASKEKVLEWNEFTREYFLERDTLCSVLLLIDASIPPVEIDIACANWLGEAEVPYTLVYTKLDKRKKGVPPAEENIAAFEEALMQHWKELPPAVATSSRTGSGKTALLSHIAQMRGLYNNTQAKLL